MNPITEIFHSVANLQREDIFEDQILMPITATQDARTPAPGWVGRAYRPGGIVLLGINPGGGGDRYRGNPTDSLLYDRLRAFRDASSPAAGAAFEAVNEAWVSIQRTHSIWRVISAVLRAARTDVDAVAFMNILPFRTREDKSPPVSSMVRAWDLAARRQLEALQPGAIVCLGFKAANALKRFGNPNELPRVFALKRARGDMRITDEARQTLTEISDWVDNAGQEV